MICISLPPLRERPEDIVTLLLHYTQYFSEQNGFSAVKLSDGALSVLSAYTWPGNIRQLRNFCENIVILKRGSEINEYDLDPIYQLNPSSLASENEHLGIASDSTLSKSENEKRLLRNALIKSNGNRTKAADLLGISRRTLHRKLIKWPELDVTF